MPKNAGDPSRNISKILLVEVGSHNVFFRFGISANYLNLRLLIDQLGVLDNQLMSLIVNSYNTYDISLNNSSINRLLMVSGSWLMAQGSPARFS